MKHGKALGIKWLFTAIILSPFLAIFEAVNIGHILCISILLANATYLVGDRFILPAFGLGVTMVVSFGLAFILIWLISARFFGQSITLVLASFIAAFVFALCEGIFQAYLKDKLLPKKQAIIIPFPKVNLQTEAAKEMYTSKDKKD